MKYKSNGEGIIDDLHAQLFVVDAGLDKREPAAAAAAHPRRIQPGCAGLVAGRQAGRLFGGAAREPRS